MRRRIAGYTDFGSIRIPPLPQRIYMTDRGDGTLWELTHNLTDYSSDGLGYISISDVISPRNKDYTLYGPEEGPILPGDPQDLVLLIRDGYLGYELVLPPVWRGAREQARILTRKGVTRITREIITPLSWEEGGDLLAWRTVANYD